MELEFNYADLEAEAIKMGAASEEAIGLLEAYVEETTVAMTLAIKDKAPSRSGRLRDSVVGISSGLQAIISVEAPYAAMIEDGASAHTITANMAQALSWPGGMHPVFSVRHPGIKANPFFDEGIAEAEAEIDALGDALLTELMELM